MIKDKSIEGVSITVTHSGQKRAYGDRMTEYLATSDRPPEHVEKILRGYTKCDLPEAQWKAENRDKPSMGNHFRAYYFFQDLGDGKFFFRETFPYAD